MSDDQFLTHCWKVAHSLGSSDMLSLGSLYLTAYPRRRAKCLFPGQFSEEFATARNSPSVSTFKSCKLRDTDTSYSLRFSFSSIVSGLLAKARMIVVNTKKLTDDREPTLGGHIILSSYKRIVHQLKAWKRV
jgi:hypothetical protein